MDIKYTVKLPSAEELFTLYDSVSWNNFLQLSKEDLLKAIKQSWFVYSAYHDQKMVGTGRIISDGVTNAYICGLVVHPHYQKSGIGKNLLAGLMYKAQNQKLHIQLFCSEQLVPYYEKHQFDVFAVGMKYNRLEKLI